MKCLTMTIEFLIETINDGKTLSFGVTSNISDSLNAIFSRRPDRMYLHRHFVLKHKIDACNAKNGKKQRFKPNKHIGFKSGNT